MIREHAVRLARYEVSADSYRSAKKLVDQFGEEASGHAKRRMEAFLAEGNEERAAAWVDVAFAIDEMQRSPHPDDRLS
ncbi:hypothetical protein [Roseomonas populi]|uniref:Uncharacterized protein n=1 Tax=Roseomonas populi TaxID=3121582 RepID=A0ABT1XBI3_9PROT|nr:hypothetical protein [Roseomonas pecuniae]MCR0985274.1 hypothetical protein [Roseomonas pecuniae]